MAQTPFFNEPESNKTALHDGGFAQIYREDALITKSHELIIIAQDPKDFETISALHDCIGCMFDEFGAKFDGDDQKELLDQLNQIDLKNIAVSKGKTQVYAFYKIKNSLKNIRRRILWLADAKGLLLPSKTKKKSHIGEME